MSHKHLLCLLGALGLSLGHAVAQSAALAWGGNPKVLSHEPSVHMESEKIKLKIGRTWTSVTCAFVLRNEGPACQVKVGFPDQVWGPNSDSSDGATKLNEFQAFVDGKKTSTTAVSGEEGGTPIIWHQRTIPFTRHQKRFVLDQYRVRTGTDQATGGISIHEIALLMHTGASWKGPIKKVNVIAQFDDDLMPDDVLALPAQRLHAKWATEYDGWDKVAHNTVYYHAFTRPTVDGNTLTFDARDLNPSNRSDVYLYCRVGGGRERHAAVKTTHRMALRRVRHKHLHNTAVAHEDAGYKPEATEQ